MMEKIIVDKSFMERLVNLFKNNQSVVFPTLGSTNPGKKFRNIRKETKSNPMILTTQKVEVSIVKNGIRIFNPLNKGFGYADLVIPFGIITFSRRSFFWEDQSHRWRQMKFSKKLGWALRLSGGVKVLFDG